MCNPPVIHSSFQASIPPRAHRAVSPSPPPPSADFDGLRAAVREAGIRKVASASGVDRRTLQRLLGGATPRPATVTRIQAALRSLALRTECSPQGEGPPQAQGPDVEDETLRALNAAIGRR